MSAEAGLSAPLVRARARLGHGLREWSYVAALAVHIVLLAVRPSSWRRSVRSVLARQIYFTGAEAVGFVGCVAALTGIAFVLQARLWLLEFGQSGLLGPILVSVIARELAPLLTGVIILVRSGSAVVSELGNMSVLGEIRLLEALGIDPLRYLVLPRVVAFVIAGICLNILFVVAAFAVGYFASLLYEINAPGPLEFAADLIAPLRAVDLWSPLAKSAIGPLIVGTLCCHAGISAGGAPTEVPKAATRALSESAMSLFVVCVAISVVSYL